MVEIISRESLRLELLEIFSRYVEPGLEISDKSSLFGDLELDSIQVIEIVSKIEDRFKVTLGEGELFGINTIEDVRRIVGDRLREAGKLE